MEETESQGFLVRFSIFWSKRALVLSFSIKGSRFLLVNKSEKLILAKTGTESLFKISEFSELESIIVVVSSEPLTTDAYANWSWFLGLLALC